MFHKILNCYWSQRFIAKYYHGRKKSVLAKIARYDEYQPTYCDFTLCTTILHLLPGYLKKWGLHNHTILVGFICLPLPSKSFPYSLTSSQTQAGDQHVKDVQALVTDWGWRPPRPPQERLQKEFKLYSVCKGATMWHKPVPRKRRQECPPQGTPATRLKRLWPLQGHSALNFEPNTMPLRGSSRFPSEREPPSADHQGTYACKQGRKESKKKGNS